MAIDLIDLAKNYLSPNVIQSAAARVGESSDATQKAFAGIVPTLVGALANTASTSDGAQQLLRMLDAGKYDGGLLNNVTSLFAGGTTTDGALNTGKGILNGLFGDKIGDVSNVIARFAGVRPESASSLLALAAPLVMHVVGTQRSSVGTGAVGLASLLGEQKNFLRGLVPPGLGSMLGWSTLPAGLSNLGTSAAGAVSRAAEVGTRPLPSVGRPRWLVPLVIIGALIVLGLAWLNWSTTSTAPVQQAARKLSELQLPGGARISVPEGSFNFSLASWLASATDTKVPKRFVFDDLNFETGSTTLTPESVATVNSLVAVLTAYPAVSVGLEGYTDNTGDADANKKLSLDRAVAVKNIMTKGGIDEARIGTAGYGQENPITSNDTEQGRAKNRRLELVVVKR